MNNNNDTLIILDWDDTLFPTSWTLKNKTGGQENNHVYNFQKLDTVLYKLFIKLMTYGTVVIVTNAMTKWIISSSNMLPMTQKIIKNNVEIISARDNFQQQYPNQMPVWKKIIFKDLTKNNNFNHIISIGDAEYEFHALVDLYERSDQKILKAIRFIQSPSFDILIDQLEVLHDTFHKVHVHNNHMDLVFNEKNFI